MPYCFALVRSAQRCILVDTGFADEATYQRLTAKYGRTQWAPPTEVLRRVEFLTRSCEPTLPGLFEARARAGLATLTEGELEVASGVLLRLGATPQELLEMMKIANVLGIHAVTTAAPILAELLVDTDGRGAGQVAEASLDVPADHGPSGFGGMGSDDQVVCAARRAGPPHVGQQAGVVGCRGGGVVQHIED